MAACSSNVETDAGSTSSSSAAVSSSAASGGGGGAGGSCATLAPAGPGPVVMAEAEAAFGAVLDSCGITQDDLDTSDINSPTLTPGGQAKACSGCACRQAIFDYYSVYAECPEEGQNSNFAQNLYAIASGC
ncbi:MAG: hypothetical protein KTR15_01705 [Phycisphaeraceae bacterium]|nr:hypothetical protein [Phycisphaeraceae bacterium]